MDAESLRGEIDQAFAVRPYPGDSEIVEERPWSDWEGSRVAAFLRGKTWRDFTLDDLVQGWPDDPFDCMVFLTVIGFCYYLPAFLCMALAPGERADNITDHLVSYLTPPGDGASDQVRERSEAIVAALSSDQRQAVAHVLQYLEAKWDRERTVGNPARRALDSRWRRFAPHRGSMS